MPSDYETPEFINALALLRSKKGYPAAKVQIHDGNAELERGLGPDGRKILTPERLAYCERFLDLVAGAFLQLVSDIESQDAYAVVLKGISRFALERYAGKDEPGECPIELFPESDVFQHRSHHWNLEGFRRLAVLNRNAAGETSGEKAAPVAAEAASLTDLPGIIDPTQAQGTCSEVRDTLEAADRSPVAATSPVTEAAPSSAKPHRKRGPTPDFETAARVAEIVAEVAPAGDWKSKLDEVCERLDENKIPIPKVWRTRYAPCERWSDCDDNGVLIKMIDYKLKTPSAQQKSTQKTSA